MKKEIKDYLHHYLGTNTVVKHCNTEFPQTGVLVGISRSEVEPGKMVAIIDGRLHEGRRPSDQFTEWYIEETVPVLRPLHTIQASDCLQVFGVIGDRVQLYTEKGFRKHGGKRWLFTATELSKLCNMGFDVFDLIPEGLAIDATTKPNEHGKEA